MITDYFTEDARSRFSVIDGIPCYNETPVILDNFHYQEEPEHTEELAKQLFGDQIEWSWVEVIDDIQFYVPSSIDTNGEDYQRLLEKYCDEYANGDWNEDTELPGTDELLNIPFKPLNIICFGLNLGSVHAL